MLLGRVAGTVVSTNKEPKIEGFKFLLVEKIDPATMKGKNDFVVAMDTVDAGVGEVVFFVSGSSARMTTPTDGRPTDASVVAIVDAIDLQGSLVYQKDRP